jgi:hypothetical protein
MKGLPRQCPQITSQQRPNFCAKPMRCSLPVAPLGISAKCSVVVTDEIFGRRVPRQCFGDLARQPLRRGVLGHRKLQQLPLSMAKNKKYE